MRYAASSAAVPRASLVILSGTLAAFNLPLAGIAVILAVDEFMDMARTTVNLNVDNVFDTRSMRQREFTFPNRGFPGPSLNEFRERNTHPIVTLGFKRTFGGAGAKPN